MTKRTIRNWSATRSGAAIRVRGFDENGDAVTIKTAVIHSPDHHNTYPTAQCEKGLYHDLIGSEVVAPASPSTETTRWLATYVDKNGKLRAAVITVPEGHSLFMGGAASDVTDESDWGLDEFDGEPVTLSSLPADPGFRPVVIDIDLSGEVPLQFIDL